MNTGEILRKIHEGPYWRVLAYPGQFREQRIESLGRCKEIVKQARVMLRGWDYPHIDTSSEGIEAYDGWVESGIDWPNNHYEIWRFYQSGQFVHQFSSRERFHQLQRVPAPERYILVYSTLYTLTEIFEFAANLARLDVLERDAVIEIELNQVAGFELTFQDLQGAFFKGHKARDDAIKRKVIVSSVALRTQPSGLALREAVAIFERFNWLDPDIRPLAEQQAKLLERRLGVTA